MSIKSQAQKQARQAKRLKKPKAPKHGQSLGPNPNPPKAFKTSEQLKVEKEVARVKRARAAQEKIAAAESKRFMRAQKRKVGASK